MVTMGTVAKETPLHPLQLSPLPSPDPVVPVPSYPIYIEGGREGGERGGREVERGWGEGRKGGRERVGRGEEGR